jgi:hypothetical protein
VNIPEIIRKELESLPHRISQGKKHYKIFVNDIFCGILPMGGGRENGREVLNLRAQIRRAAKGVKEWMQRRT